MTEEGFLNSEYYDADVFETENDLNLEVTIVTADAYQTKPNKTLNLRLGPKQVVQNPKKKVVLPPKQQSDPVLEKKQNQDKQKKNVEVEKVNKSMQNPHGMHILYTFFCICNVQPIFFFRFVYNMYLKAFCF